MKITIKNKYKAIDPFIWEDIPALAIISGLNGVGKSQLLNFIQSHPNVVQKEDSTSYSKSEITYWNSQGMLYFRTNSSFELYDLIGVASQLKDFSDPLTKLVNIRNPQAQKFRNNQQQRLNKLKLNVNIRNKESEIIRRIEAKSSKSILNLTFEEIMYFFPDDLFFSSGNINQSIVEMTFFMYHFRKTSDIANGVDMTGYPLPPWKLLNEVFETSNLPFEVNNPTDINVSFNISNINQHARRNNQIQFSLKLTHKENKQEIAFNDISSGEKVIMSLAFLLYYAQTKNSYNRLLLLDEPDAHLHPSMTKQFLDVVDSFLIRKYGAKVIMATHSPSTIGLCKQESIFVMTSNPTKVEHLKRQEAIKFLTSGVPTLASVVDNRRYVFVEDKDDATFYTTVYNITVQEICNEVNLIFIPVSSPRIGKSGGVSVVREWTRKMRAEGQMDLVKGLIDKDISNSPADGIVVIKRYSIENYLFDPIFIAAVLIHEGELNQIENIEFPQKNCNKLEMIVNSDLQLVIDFITTKFETEFKTAVEELNQERVEKNKIENTELSNNELDKVSTTLRNGNTVEIPNWVYTRRGHDLEAIYRKIFYNGKSIGQKHFIDIHERIPQLISIELTTTMKELL